MAGELRGSRQDVLRLSCQRRSRYPKTRGDQWVSRNEDYRSPQGHRSHDSRIVTGLLLYGLDPWARHSHARLLLRLALKRRPRGVLAQSYNPNLSAHSATREIPRAAERWSEDRVPSLHEGSATWHAELRRLRFPERR